MKKQRMAPLKDGLMLQEIFQSDPWKLLIACQMLNQTTGVQVHKVIYDFFYMYPTPHSVIKADSAEMQEVIRSLGLYKRRTELIKRFSHDYLEKDWMRPSECAGIGKYAEDSWDIFVAGNLRVKPMD